MNDDCSRLPPPSRQRIESYLDRLFGYAYSLTRDRDSAQDLVQTCAVKALAAERVPRDEPAYRAWLFEILRNLFIDSVRKQRMHPQSFDEEAENLEQNRNNSSTSYVSAIDQRLINTLSVREGLLRMSVDHREVVVLVDLVGFSYRETARFLKVPVGTVMSRLCRARQVLIHELSKKHVKSSRLKIVKFRK